MGGGGTAGATGARFCIVCGNVTDQKTIQPWVFCSNCGIIFFHKSAVGVGDPKDSLIHRLEALDKKAAELDREIAMYRPLGSMGNCGDLLK